MNDFGIVMVQPNLTGSLLLIAIATGSTLT
jgi:hypothetical protein